MRTVTLELPTQIAKIFDSLTSKQKSNAALLAAAFAQRSLKKAEDVFAIIDEHVKASGKPEDDIERLLSPIAQCIS